MRKLDISFINTEIMIIRCEQINKKRENYTVICFNKEQAEKMIAEIARCFSGWISDWFYDLKDKVYVVEMRRE